MLKIIAGTAKGQTLHSLPRSAFVRPILARIKKSLFDILKPRLPGSRFLDLYAGIGTVGLEALSRGARHASFVEQDAACLRVLQDNLDHLGLSQKGTVFRGNALDDLSYLPKPFDVIFMGPPYKDEQKKPLALVGPTLEIIGKNELLASDGIIVAQHHKKEKVSSTALFDLFRNENYGDSVLSFFRPLS